jgi:hypothetical protein
VQVELGVSGQPTKDPDAHYFAQVYEGSYSDKRSGKGHEEHSVGAGPTLALARFDRLLVEGILLAKAQAYRRARGADLRRLESN